MPIQGVLGPIEPDELGFTRAEANSLRGAYREKLAEFQR